MNCVSCKKTIDQPLELFDGEWACPHCRRIVGGMMTDFVITYENDRIFQLAENIYLAWLDDAVHRAGRSGADDAKQLRKAVELTREAAALGNPEAVVRLGYYYDKDYTEATKSETARCRAAYAYYSAVCFADPAKLKIEDGVKVSFDFKALQIRAARYLLKMLANAPAELVRKEKFDYEKNKTDIEDRLGIKCPSAQKGGLKPSAQEQAFAKLRSCHSAHKAPLFGVIKLTGAEFEELAAMKVGLDTLIRFIKRGVQLSAVKANRDGKVGYDDVFETLKNERALNEYLASADRGGSYWLFFFNPKGGHRFYGKIGLDKIRKALVRDDHDVVKRIIDAWTGEDLTFMDDDVYMCKVKMSIRSAVEQLADTVQNGGFKR